MKVRNLIEDYSSDIAISKLLEQKLLRTFLLIEVSRFPSYLRVQHIIKDL